MITISDYPQGYTPAFNPVVFSVLSDEADLVGFKYIVDVRDAAGNYIATAKYQPPADPSEPIQLDLQRFLHELVGSGYCNLNDTQTDQIVGTSGGATYYVDFSESAPGASGITGKVTASGRVFNAALKTINFAFYEDSNYLGKKWLTRFNRLSVEKTDSLQLSFIQSAAISGVTFQAYGADGGGLVGATLGPAPDDTLCSVNCGWNFLYNEIGFSESIYNNAAYYTLTLPSGDAMRIDIRSICSRHQGVRLYFLNELGGFDGFTFKMADTDTLEVERKGYLRQPIDKRTAYDSTSRRFEATRRNYYTRVTESKKLVSDFLSDTESALLAELFTSPLIYMEKDLTEAGGPAKVLVPVELKTNSYTIKKLSVDRLFNLEVELTLTYDNYRQTV